MDIVIREYGPEDIEQMTEIWNEVVLAGDAFPQTEGLDAGSAGEFFASQTYCAAAYDAAHGKICGLYILHPNNIGRCGHICNASFAVCGQFRGRRVGELLVRDCLEKAKEYGFRVMQFNAVVASNRRARSLYEKLGFVPLGTVPEGFRLKNGAYADICLYYKTL
jgi:L-amino acid N-acyltransferase YncA